MKRLALQLRGNTMWNNLKKTLFAVMIVAAMGIEIKANAAAPTGAITAISPNIATALSAGEVIEIVGVGTNFTTIPSATVWIGAAVTGTPCTAFELVDDLHIICQVPSVARGVYTITVTNAANGNAL